MSASELTCTSTETHLDKYSQVDSTGCLLLLLADRNEASRGRGRCPCWATRFFCVTAGALPSLPPRATTWTERRRVGCLDACTVDRWSCGAAPLVVGGGSMIQSFLSRCDTPTLTLTLTLNLIFLILLLLLSSPFPPPLLPFLIPTFSLSSPPPSLLLLLFTLPP